MRGLLTFTCLLFIAGTALADTQPAGNQPPPAEPAPKAAAVDPPVLTCVQNLMPKDGWKRIDANHKATADTPERPQAPCDPSVRWVVRMEDAIAFHLKGYSAWVAQGDNARKTLHVFVEGIELENLTPRRQGPAGGTGEEVLWTPLKFESRKGSEVADRSRETWAQVLRIARNTEGLKISVGPEGGPYWASSAEIEVNSFPTFLAWSSGLIVFALGGALVWLGLFSSLLHDDNGNATPPFSLARHQMAVWFFVVIAAFLFVTMSTGAAAATSTTALVLIGISGATGLVAIAIDKSKRETVDAVKAKLKTEAADLSAKLNQAGTGLLAQQAALLVAAPGSAQAVAVGAEIQKTHDRLTAIAAELAAMPTPVPSQGWWKDLLSDDNGVSLHRLQILVWTVVFVGVFIVTVWRTFAMPDFDATTLGLIGISSGMYLGFKFPEKAT